jgi:hypothetical protein
MTNPDLTPAEARAEVEAFMGDGWMCDGSVHHDGDAIVWAHRAGCHQYGMAPTFRAAVDALKSAWRDAVRPWVRSAYSCGWSCANGGWDRDGNIDRDVAAVLKEDS